MVKYLRSVPTGEGSASAAGVVAACMLVPTAEVIDTKLLGEGAVEMVTAEVTVAAVAGRQNMALLSPTLAAYKISSTRSTTTAVEPSFQDGDTSLALARNSLSQARKESIKHFFTC